MIEELEAIKEEMDKTVGEGRNEERARSLANAFVAAHPDQFAQMNTMSLDNLVKSVDILREAGFEDDQWRVEAFLLSKFEPLNVGGSFQPAIRVSFPLNGDANG